MSDCLTGIDTYRTVKIEQIEDENRSVKTFRFKDILCNKAEIGQYIMLWVKGVDEIPLSLSEIDSRGLSSVTVENVGEATSSLHSKIMGNTISIRGPYGNHFSIIQGKVLVIGGGVGLAPLRPLLVELGRRDSKITLIVGAKTKMELLSLNRVKSTLGKSIEKLIITTDDGSYGIKGVATAPMDELFDKNVFDVVYSCGPEPMMRKVFEIAENRGIEVQVCTERIIRCSVGLCGSCVIGRFRVCKEGPIFSSTQLREVLNEFGVFKRGFTGKKIAFKESIQSDS